MGVSMRQVLAGLVGAILSLVSVPSEATIVFDFEDGLQGWTLFAASRQETNALGGSYAIGGIDGSMMSIEMDLSSVETIAIDRLFTGENSQYFEFVGLSVEALEGPFAREFLGVGETDDQSANPDTRLFDVSEFGGLHEVTIIWNSLICIPPDFQCLFINFPGLIDNVTFLSVPEPGLASLLGTLALLLLFLRASGTRFAGPTSQAGGRRNVEFAEGSHLSRDWGVPGNQRGSR